MRNLTEFTLILSDALPSSAGECAGLWDLLTQIGVGRFNDAEWAQIVANGTFRCIVPMALRAATRIDAAHADALNVNADRCATDDIQTAALAAAEVVRASDAWGMAATLAAVRLAAEACDDATPAGSRAALAARAARAASTVADIAGLDADAPLRVAAAIGIGAYRQP